MRISSIVQSTRYLTMNKTNNKPLCYLYYHHSGEDTRHKKYSIWVVIISMAENKEWEGGDRWAILDRVVKERLFPLSRSEGDKETRLAKKWGEKSIHNSEKPGPRPWVEYENNESRLQTLKLLLPSVTWNKFLILCGPHFSHL